MFMEKHNRIVVSRPLSCAFLKNSGRVNTPDFLISDMRVLMCCKSVHGACV